MARFILFLVLAACISVALIDARKKDKWGNRKHHQKSSAMKLKAGVPVVMDTNAMSKSKRLGDYGAYKLETSKQSAADNKWLKRKWRKGKHGHGKQHKKNKPKNKAFKVKKHMPWLNFLPDEDCKLDCKPNEVCIVGPIDTEPLCVHMKDLKKSVRLFRKYQKKEKRTWRKFQKKHYGHAKKFEYRTKKGELSFDAKWDKKRLAHERKELMKKRKSGEEVPLIAMEPTEAGDPKAKGCSTRDFSQMRTRIMGWFHVLHGQDKDFMKRRGKAHKHSVKKQLEIYESGHCDCLHSAMWEFEQMDTDKSGELTETELASLGENTMEPCMQPYMTSCDKDSDGKLSSDEWCCCFSNVLTPCYKRMKDIKKSGEEVSYLPRCDREGYYVPEQCEGAGDSTICWCVDYNGNMFDGTKTNGRIDCSKYAMFNAEGRHFTK